MRHLAIFAASLATMAASSASAQPVLTDVAKVVDAVEDCAGSINDLVFDEKKLRERGWAPIEIQMTNNPLPESPLVYGKSPSHPLIRIVKNPLDQKGCMVEGWLEPSEDRAKVVPSLIKKFRVVTKLSGVDIRELNSGASVKDGTTAIIADDAIVIPLDGDMLGNSDFRLVVSPYKRSEPEAPSDPDSVANADG